MKIQTVESLVGLTKELISGKSKYLNGELSKLSSTSPKEEKKKIIANCKAAIDSISKRLDQLESLE